MFHRQEAHANAIFAWARKSEAKFAAFLVKELMWNLDQHAGAIASFRIAPACSAVRQVDQDLNPFGDDIV